MDKHVRRDFLKYEIKKIEKHIKQIELLRKSYREELESIELDIENEKQEKFILSLEEVTLEGEFEPYNRLWDKILFNPRTNRYYYCDGKNLQLFARLNAFLKIGDYTKLRYVGLTERRHLGKTQMFDYEGTHYIYEFNAWVVVA